MVADVHLPLEEQRPVATLLPRGVQIHQPVSTVMADSWGLTVPVDHLEPTKVGKGLHLSVNIMKSLLMNLSTSRLRLIVRGKSTNKLMHSTHLLVLLLVAPVGPHVTSVDARQHHGTAEQHHIHRLLSIPEALFFATFMVIKKKRKTNRVSFKAVMS